MKLIWHCHACFELISADGSVVFQADKPALFDVQRPSVMSYVCDKNGEWDNSMLWTSGSIHCFFLLPAI